MSLFHLLIGYLKLYQDNNEEIWISDDIKERTESYFSLSNDFRNWFDEKYEKTEDSFLGYIDIYNIFKYSDIYKDSRNKPNKAVFKELLKRNFPVNYKEKCTIKGTRESKRCVILGFSDRIEKTNLLIEDI
jgi:hypothetical protein